MSRGAYALAVIITVARAAGGILVAVLEQLAGNGLALVTWHEEVVLSLEALRLERLHDRSDEILTRYRDNAHRANTAAQRMEHVAAQRRRRVAARLADGWPDDPLVAMAMTARSRVTRCD